MQVRIWVWLLVFVGFLPLCCVGQSNLTLKVSTHLEFLNDSIKIGEPVSVSFTVRHPINTEVLFPDTQFNIEPLKIVQKNWFPTRSDSVTSTDSAVYLVTTWLPTKGYTLALPIYAIDELGDSLPIESNTDTIYFKSVFVPEKSKGIVSQTNFEIIPERFNYPYWTLGGVGILLLLVFLVFFFGKPLQRGFRLLLLWRSEQLFESTFDRLASQAIRTKNIKALEQTLSLWKQHLERLTTKAFTTYTTKDFYNDLEDERLFEVLQLIDRGIYGGSSEVIEPEIFPVLKGYAVRFYKARRAAINNG